MVRVCGSACAFCVPVLTGKKKGVTGTVPVPESAAESCARLYGNARTGRGPGASAAARPKRLARGAIGEAAAWYRTTGI
jgi:hypothetical protein